MDKTIGVFDSGVGGQSFVRAIEKAFPAARVIYVTDKENIPYGDKNPEELYKLTLPILNTLSKDCDVIVVACNTVSTTIIDRLREKLPLPLIAVEPMIKPAAQLTQTGVIAVCATPATLASQRYAWLKQEYASDITVLEPDCSKWSQLIESQQIDRSHVEQQINEVCEQGADVIVLGCTHYHWIQDIIEQVAAGRAQVIQPEPAAIRQLTRVLAQLD